MYPIIAIVAMAKNRVIGDGSKLLWHLPGDLPRVKDRTMGRPLIMGRKTFESIGRPLAGRGNIVLTQNPDFTADGVLVAHTTDDALAKARTWIDEEAGRIGEIIIFGGGVIYDLFLDRIDEIDLTELDLAPQGSALFPELNPREWAEVSRKSYPQEGDSPAHDLIRLKRR